MLDESTNTMAQVSIGCAVGLVVLYLFNMCLGMVPLVGLLALFVYPVLLILALVGLTTGLLGYRHSQQTLAQVGRSQSLIGASICGLWLLFQALVVGLTVVMVGLVMVLEAVG